MLNCVIFQSSFQSLPLLENILQNSSEINLEKQIAYVPQAKNFIRKQPAEIIFCDMELDAEEIKSIRGLNPSSLMVYVGCREVAKEKVTDENAFGFLFKPYSQERVLSIVNKAQDYLGYSKPQGRNFVFIKSEYKMVRVNLNEILFCEGMKDYTKIYLKDNGKSLVTLQNLKTQGEKLDQRNFVRVHRSYIVSIEKIDTISKHEIHIGTHEIPIGDAYRDKLFQLIDSIS